MIAVNPTHKELGVGLGWSWLASMLNMDVRCPLHGTVSKYFFELTGPSWSIGVRV